jgi:hypothetical protein
MKIKKYNRIRVKSKPRKLSKSEMKQLAKKFDKIN